MIRGGPRVPKNSNLRVNICLLDVGPGFWRRERRSSAREDVPVLPTIRWICVETVAGVEHKLRRNVLRAQALGLQPEHVAVP